MKKLLYIPYVLLLIIEWLLDMGTKIWQVVHNSVKELTLALENYMNEPTSASSPTADSTE